MAFSLFSRRQMSLVDATILHHLEATTRDLMQAEASAELAQNRKERYEKTRDVLAPLLREKYPKRADISFQTASAYKRAMRPWILSADQLKQIEDNRKIGTKSSREANNRLVNRVSSYWEKIINSVYDCEDSEDEGDDTQDPTPAKTPTPAKKKQKVQDAIELLKSCTPDEIKEIFNDRHDDIVCDVRKLFEL